MSLPTVEMSPPRFEVAVRQTGRTGPDAGSDEVVSSTTSVFVRFATPAIGSFAAATKGLPPTADVSFGRLG